MDINKTRLGLIYIFSENENTSKQAKLQLINFIEQADEHQLKVLMMDGELVSKDKLDEQAREIVNDRFEGLNEAVIVAAAAVIAATALLARRSRKILYKQLINKCGNLKGSKKKICMQQAKQKAIQGEISMYKSQMNKCGQTKNPEKCKKSIQKHIMKAEIQLKKTSKKLAY